MPETPDEVLLKLARAQDRFARVRFTWEMLVEMALRQRPAVVTGLPKLWRYSGLGFPDAGDTVDVFIYSPELKPVPELDVAPFLDVMVIERPEDDVKPDAVV
jgi:hypothetical protein